MIERPELGHSVPGTKFLCCSRCSQIPCKLEVSDLNYLVSTPDRRKTRQLCRINMLKPYHNRPMKVVSVVHQPIVESSVEDKDWQDEEPPVKPDIIPCKLSNSDILQRLDFKRSHLEPTQRDQMTELIWKYKNLFPDVPKRTHVATYDVNVGDAPPIKQHP